MLKRLKPYVRWAILGATLFFLAKALRDNWQGVLELRLTSAGPGLLAAALVVTLAAHVWSGWVWGLLLRGILASGLSVTESLKPSEVNASTAVVGADVSGAWAIATYLRTNIAKYLPGNIWHFYSRLQACKTNQISTAPALLSIVLEPLLMAAAALIVASGSYPGWQTLALLPILLGVHPQFINPILQRLAKGKLASLSKHSRSQARRGAGLEQPADEALQEIPASTVQLKRYPIAPLLGEVCFVLMRGLGFVLALAALGQIEAQQLPVILGGFSLAWVLGLVVPGAPGGIGVFELMAIALLQSSLAPEIIVGAVAAYRLISTLAEGIGAGFSFMMMPGRRL